MGNTKLSKPIVDRRWEGGVDEEGDFEITVTLECGHRERFWLMGLTDEEYIARTREMKRLELAGGSDR